MAGLKAGLLSLSLSGMKLRSRPSLHFYASTEGNANLVNNCQVVGACGVVPFFLSWIYPVMLARDATTGRAQAVSAGEPGELLGLIKADDPSRRFDGYTDRAASAAKVARDVRRPGDAWFRTGARCRGRRG